jgi:hypothetical protein
VDNYKEMMSNQVSDDQVRAMMLKNKKLEDNLQEIRKHLQTRESSFLADASRKRKVIDLMTSELKWDDINPKVRKAMSSLLKDVRNANEQEIVAIEHFCVLLSETTSFTRETSDEANGRLKCERLLRSVIEELTAKKVHVVTAADKDTVEEVIAPDVPVHHQMPQMPPRVTRSRSKTLASVMEAPDEPPVSGVKAPHVTPSHSKSSFFNMFSPEYEVK